MPDHFLVDYNMSQMYGVNVKGESEYSTFAIFLRTTISRKHSKKNLEK